jgi:hypothetical protein
VPEALAAQRAIQRSQHARVAGLLPARTHACTARVVGGSSSSMRQPSRSPLPHASPKHQAPHAPAQHGARRAQAQPADVAARDAGRDVQAQAGAREL